MIKTTNPHFSQNRVSRDLLPTQSSNYVVKAFIFIFADILGPTCSWDRDIYAKYISFYLFLWCVLCMVQNANIQKNFWKKESKCNFCKAILKILFSSIFGFSDVFWFGHMINSKYLSIYWFVTFYCLTMVLKLKNK